MNTKQSRPGLGTEAAASSLAATYRVSDPDLFAEQADRPRCLRCGHPLTLPRSLARAYGPRCWRRTVIGQLEARRDAVGRLLARLAVRVAVADAAALLVVSDALLDVLAVLDAELVTA